MKEGPLLFSPPMVRAILDGRKSQTRRIIAPQPLHTQRHEYKGKLIYDEEHSMWCWKDLVLENIWDFVNGEDRKTLATRCPFGKIGDTIWVRESFYIASAGRHEYGIGFKADHKTGRLVEGDGGYNFRPFSDDDGEAGEQWNWAAKHTGTDKWIPGIFMPRWVSRITLEITDVRVSALAGHHRGGCQSRGRYAVELRWDKPRAMPHFRRACARFPVSQRVLLTSGMRSTQIAPRGSRIRGCGLSIFGW